MLLLITYRKSHTGFCVCVIWTAIEPAYIVAVFDIDRYIYVFFRELALESTALCDKTYYSRVARVCKVFNSSIHYSSQAYSFHS